MGNEIHEFTHLPGGAGGADAGSAPMAAIRGSAQRPAGEPLVGLIYNPRSRRNRGRDFAEFDRPGVLNARPDTREELPGVMRRFAEAGVEFLIISGGDGTIRDVLTAGQPYFGDKWPAVAVMPKGKTNALNVDLGAPGDWSLSEAIKAYKHGSRHSRRPLALHILGDDGKAQSAEPLLGFILGAGAIAQGVKTGQDAHRIGAFNSFAVGLTGAWGVLQAVFGGAANPWRSGVAVNIDLSHEGAAGPVPLAHCGKGAPDRRFLLLSTTLEKMPVGISPFGKAAQQSGIKLAAMDITSRWLMAAFPAIMFGFAPRWLSDAGFHQVAADSYTMDIADQFILDGEVFPAGTYRVAQGPLMDFVVP